MLSLVSAVILSAALTAQDTAPAGAAPESPDVWADGLVGSLLDVAETASPDGRIVIDDPESLADDLTGIMDVIWPILQAGEDEDSEFSLSFDLHVYAAGETRAGDEMCPAGSDGVAFEGPLEDAGAGTTVRVCRGFEETAEGDFYGQAIVLTNGAREGVFIFTLLAADEETAIPVADAGALISERLAASVRFPG